jgi:sugar phosphate isomerase/epimerase
MRPEPLPAYTASGVHPTLGFRGFGFRTRQEADAMVDALTKAGYDGVIVVCTPSSVLATPRQPKKAVKKAAKRP